MNPLVASGLITGGAGLISGLLNYGAANDTNSLAREQFEKNLKFQKYQYEDMKRYNSFKNQRRMMQEAGLNPSLMFGSGASPVGASSVGGVAPTASQTTPDFSFLPSGMGNLLSSLTQASLAKSEEDKNYAGAAKDLQEAIGNEIDNAYKHRDWNSLFNLRRTQADLFESEADYNITSLHYRVSQEHQKALMLEYQAEAQKLSNAWLPKHLQNEFTEKLASIALLRSQKRLTDKQASEIIMSTIAHYGLSKDDAYDVYDASMDYLEEQADNANSQSFSNWTKGITSANIPMSIGTYQMGESVNRQVKRKARQAVRRAARAGRR